MYRRKKKRVPSTSTLIFEVECKGQVGKRNKIGGARALSLFGGGGGAEQSERKGGEIRKKDLMDFLSE